MVPLMLLGVEETIREENQAERQFRENLRVNRNVLELQDERFVRNFRVSRYVFREILDEIGDEISPTYRNGITAIQKLAATLRFLAEGTYQHGVGKDFFVPMAQSTFSVVLSQTLDAIERKLCAKWIRLNMTIREKEDANAFFFSKSGIPGVVMCVDGTHIRIMKPRTNQHLYYNRKGYFSINALMICDNRQKIRFVNAKYGGASHDSHVWNRSPADNFFAAKYRNEEQDFKLLGDSAYPGKPWIIKPIRNAQPYTSHAEYNSRHSKGRFIIERAFGVLKSRFQCIAGARQLHYTPEKSLQIINVCSALHNMMIEHRQ
ncbi:putative nuclease HARBI1 [Anopheles ziemanni]|uniref:putative nuclease HARBI1 n=1 Tax=Anopheles coustani TaxID=139045 RepID=UPI0026586A14|nr:putative nuclease HARBI1 [Anopheles coustani]XP_058170464.1 putative nuclease HARBI1 [Anopheles ziemanni]